MVTNFIRDQWGSNRVVSKGTMLYPAELEGFAAVRDEKIVGLATYRIEGEECEVVTINSLTEGTGIGSYDETEQSLLVVPLGAAMTLFLPQPLSNPRGQVLLPI